jgi:hypothetical protein
VTASVVPVPIKVPLAGNRWVTFTYPHDLTRAEYERVLSIIVSVGLLRGEENEP